MAFPRSWPGRPALAIGGLLGSINGVMVAAVRTNPFVTTLSTLLIFQGAAFIILRGQPLSHIRVFQAIDSGFTLGTTFLPFRGVLFLALTVLSWLILFPRDCGKPMTMLASMLSVFCLALASWCARAGVWPGPFHSRRLAPIPFNGA